MKRVIVALAAIIGLSENAPESTQKQTSHISALHQREPLFNISRPTLPHQDKEYALQQDELELQLEAAKACPVNVIRIIDDETGERLV